MGSVPSVGVRRKLKRKFIVNGFTVDVFWRFSPMEGYAADIFKEKEEDIVGDTLGYWARSARGKTLRELFGQIRFQIAECLNPKVGEVLNKLEHGDRAAGVYEITHSGVKYLGYDSSANPVTISIYGGSK